MIDCQSATVSFETPPSWRNQRLIANPFDDMPTTPRIHNRVSSETAKRLLVNLETLSAPSLYMDSPTKRRKPSLPFQPTFTGLSSSRPMFDAALQRMRDGRALERLKAERDAASDAETLAVSAQEPPTLLLSPTKGDSKQELSQQSSVVTLAKKMPRRNSGVALSA